MTKCDYCGKQTFVLDFSFLSLDRIEFSYKGNYFNNSYKQFCSKKCLMSYISESCRKIGIKSEEEEVWK